MQSLLQQAVHSLKRACVFACSINVKHLAQRDRACQAEPEVMAAATRICCNQDMAKQMTLMLSYVKIVISIFI